MLGGSIQPNKVRMADIEPRDPQGDSEDPRVTWNKVLQRLAADEAGPSHGVQLSQLRDDLTNYEYRNDLAYYQHKHWFEKHPEETLYKGALPLFSGKGAAHDDPATHKFFVESFREHPELLQMYTQGKKKEKQQISTQWRNHHTQPHLMLSHSRIK